MLDFRRTVIAAAALVFALSMMLGTSDHNSGYSSVQSKILAKFYALPTAPGGGF